MRNMYLLFSMWVTLSLAGSPLAAQSNISGEPDPAGAVQGDSVGMGANPVFIFSLKKDLPVVVGSGAMAIGGTLLKYSVPPLTEAQLAALDPASVNAFDRVAIEQYRVADAKLSDYLLLASYAAPFSVLASRSVRQEFGPVLIMYAETAALIGGLTGLSKGLFKRNRPFTYNPDALMADRLSQGARHSFFSGHVSNSAAFSFFTAYMVNRYAQRPAWKVVAWAGAAIIPGTIGYWRYTSGKHYPSDILTGYLVGAGTGILIPYLHQWKQPNDVSFNLQPLPSGVLITVAF